MRLRRVFLDERVQCPDELPAVPTKTSKEFGTSVMQSLDDAAHAISKAASAPPAPPFGVRAARKSKGHAWQAWESGVRGLLGFNSCRDEECHCDPASPSDRKKLFVA